MVNGVNGDGGGGILWNNNDTRNGYDSSSLGSDESLGGALLTPIPWLRNGLGGVEGSSEESGQLDSDQSASTDSLGEPLLMPEHGGSDPLVPERPDGAVTQGELMRMEQEAGVIPVTQNPHEGNGAVLRTMAGAEEGLYMDEDGDAVPHARGPDIVGSVDMGRVGGQDVQIRIGSPPQEDGKTADANDAQTVLPGQDDLPTVGESDAEVSSTAESDDFEIVLKDSEGTAADADAMQVDESGVSDKKQEQNGQQATEVRDGDVVLVDADGKTEDEAASKADATGENIGPDAVDTSTVT